MVLSVYRRWVGEKGKLMNMNSELLELEDEDLDAVEGGLHCAAGAHLTNATLDVRSGTTANWLDLVLIAVGL